MPFETTLLSELTIRDFFTIMTNFMMTILTLFFMLRFIVNVALKQLYDVIGWLWNWINHHHAGKNGIDDEQQGNDCNRHIDPPVSAIVNEHNHPQDIVQSN